MTLDEEIAIAEGFMRRNYGALRALAGRELPRFRMFDPEGKIILDPRYRQKSKEGAEMTGMGYPKNSTFWISVIEDPIAPLDPADQKPPRFALKPTAYLAPSVEIAFMMAAKDLVVDVDLQRCRVRVGEG